MGTITTSTDTGNFQYPSQSYLDRSPFTGNLVVVLRKTTGALSFWTSSDSGSTWTDLGIDITRANLQEWSGVFIDTGGYLHFAYRVYESGQDKICYRRAGSSGGTLTFDPEVTVATATAASAGTVYTGVDLIATILDNDDTAVHFAVGTTSGATNGVTMFSMWVYVAYSWYSGYYTVYQVYNSIIKNTRQWLATGSGRITPSLDFRHNGDGHTSSQPDLWITWGSGVIYLTKIPYNNYQWSGSVAVTAGTPSATMTHTPGRYDGSRFLVPIVGASGVVSVIERDTSNTISTTRNSPVHPQGVVRGLSINYVPASSTGDFRLYAIGTSNANLYWVDYVRATDTWGAWQGPSTTIANTLGFGSRRSAALNARYNHYTLSGTSPYTLATTATTLTFAPNTPVLTTPQSGVAQRVDAGLTIGWTFSDTDSADSQTAYAMSRQIGAGTIQYWQASTSTWVASEVQNSSTSNSVTLASGWGADSDATHVYKVKVWDTDGLFSPYSQGVSVIPSARVNPTITAPVNASTFTGNLVAVTWTVSEQTQYRVKLYQDPGLVLVYDTGVVTSAQTTHNIPYVLSDNTTYEVSVNTYNNEGLISATAQNLFNVDFVEPATPTLQLEVLSALGVIRNTVTNPAPTGGQPNTLESQLFRRVYSATPPTTITSFPLSDTFARTVVSGWGTAESGQTWNTNGGTSTDYNVGSSKGTVLLSVVNSTRHVYVSNINRKSGRFQFDALLGLVPAVAIIETFAMLRFTDVSNHYRCRFRWNTDGTIRLQIDKRIGGTSTTLATLTAVSGLTVTSVTTVSCACSIDDSGLIQMKAWRTLSGEPAGWQLSFTNTEIPTGNGVGIAGIRATGNTDATATYSYDNVLFTGTDVIGNTDGGVMVAGGLQDNSVVDDFKVASGIDYEYRALTKGTNGTSAYSSWVR